MSNPTMDRSDYMARYPNCSLPAHLHCLYLKTSNIPTDLPPMVFLKWLFRIPNCCILAADMRNFPYYLFLGFESAQQACNFSGRELRWNDLPLKLNTAKAPLMAETPTILWNPTLSPSTYSPPTPPVPSQSAQSPPSHPASTALPPDPSPDPPPYPSPSPSQTSQIPSANVQSLKPPKYIPTPSLSSASPSSASMSSFELANIKHLNEQQCKQITLQQHQLLDLQDQLQCSKDQLQCYKTSNEQMQQQHEQMHQQLQSFKSTNEQLQQQHEQMQQANEQLQQQHEQMQQQLQSLKSIIMKHATALLTGISNMSMP